MGASGSKTHEAFTVAPSTASSAVTGDDMAQAAQAPPVDETPIDVADVGGISEAGSFEELCAATAQAIADGSPSDAVHHAVGAWLHAQPAAELHELATTAGLEHAEELSAGAVAHWLDPSYPPDAPTKATIAAKALERHLAHVAAGTVTDDLPPADGESWTATPGQLLDAQSAFTTALGDVSAWTQKSDPAPLAALLAAEQTLATAHCPQLAAEHAAARAAAKQAVDAVIDQHQPAVRKLIHAGVAAGEIDPATAATLSPADVLALQRATTPAATIADLHTTAQTRNAQLATELAAHSALTGVGPGPLDPAAIATFAANASAYRDARTQIATWRTAAAIPPPAPAFLGDDDLAARFRTAAKATPIGDVRAGVVAMGLPTATAATASRAQLQNWALGAWHPHHDQAAIAATMAPKPVPAPTTPAATASPPASNGAPSSGSGVTAGSGRWHAKHAELVAGLKHHAATLNDLPSRPDPAAVAAWTFTTGPALSLGGMHTKSVHTAPDGSTWMFKPDKLGGARATAEATANRILHRAGIPTIPVYERRLGNQTGTVQPLLKGATQLSSNPSAWSQADIDAIVRYHTAAWVIGDHDAKHDNLLRTPGGGLVPIDHGQAFKFYGRDKLSASYHPNGSYGASPPVWHQLYEAHRTGGLAPGATIRPHVAVPVIKAFESIPDTEFASLLRPTATTGAATAAIHWRDAMSARATAAGHPNPTAGQVADAFIAHGLERKHGLRASFASFLASEKIAGADILTKTS